MHGEKGKAQVDRVDVLHDPYRARTFRVFIVARILLANFAMLEFDSGADGDIKGEHSPPD